MARKVYRLDTSAMFTLIEREPGFERVKAVLREEETLLPSPVLLEVHYISRQEQGQGEADRRYSLMKQLPCEILWRIDEPTLLTASRFKAAHRLSLADSLIAAFAHQQEAILLHKDPEFEALADQVELEGLPYKASKIPSQSPEPQCRITFKTTGDGGTAPDENVMVTQSIYIEEIN